MTLGERIKKLRKELDLTQQKLADRLGVKQNTIALIESGKRNTSDQLLFSVCREFNVSEEWLRNGEGEMFVPKPETTIDQIVREYGLDDLDRQIIKEFIELSDQDRAAVKAYIQSIISTRKQGEAAKKAEFMKLASDSYDSEQEQASQALSAKESDVG